MPPRESSVGLPATPEVSPDRKLAFFSVLMCGSQLAWRNMGLPEIGRLRPPTSLSGATARGGSRPAEAARAAGGCLVCRLRAAIAATVVL